MQTIVKKSYLGVENVTRGLKLKNEIRKSVRQLRSSGQLRSEAQQWASI